MLGFNPFGKAPASLPPQKELLEFETESLIKDMNIFLGYACSKQINVFKNQVKENSYYCKDGYIFQKYFYLIKFYNVPLNGAQYSNPLLLFPEQQSGQLSICLLNIATAILFVFFAQPIITKEDYTILFNSESSENLANTPFKDDFLNLSRSFPSCFLNNLKSTDYEDVVCEIFTQTILVEVHDITCSKIRKSMPYSGILSFNDVILIIDRNINRFENYSSLIQERSRELREICQIFIVEKRKNLADLVLHMIEVYPFNQLIVKLFTFLKAAYDQLKPQISEIPENFTSSVKKSKRSLEENEDLSEVVFDLEVEDQSIITEPETQKNGINFISFEEWLGATRGISVSNTSMDTESRYEDPTSTLKYQYQPTTKFSLEVENLFNIPQSQSNNARPKVGDSQNTLLDSEHELIDLVGEEGNDDIEIVDINDGNTSTNKSTPVKPPHSTHLNISTTKKSDSISELSKPSKNENISIEKLGVSTTGLNEKPENNCDMSSNGKSLSNGLGSNDKARQASAFSAEKENSFESHSKDLTVTEIPYTKDTEKAATTQSRKKSKTETSKTTPSPVPPYLESFRPHIPISEKDSKFLLCASYKLYIERNQISAMKFFAKVHCYVTNDFIKRSAVRFTSNPSTNLLRLSSYYIYSGMDIIFKSKNSKDRFDRNMAKELKVALDRFYFELSQKFQSEFGLKFAKKFDIDDDIRGLWKDLLASCDPEKVDS